MAWLKVEQSFPVHRKTLLGAQLMSMDPYRFIGHVLTFWLWALDHADDTGCLPPLDCEALGQRSGVGKRQAQHFIEVLTSTGFLEVDGDYHVIHNWKRYAGALNEKRARNALRQKNFRARNALVTHDGA